MKYLLLYFLFLLLLLFLSLLLLLRQHLLWWLGLFLPIVHHKGHEGQGVLVYLGGYLRIRLDSLARFVLVQEVSVERGHLVVVLFHKAVELLHELLFVPKLVSERHHLQHLCDKHKCSPQLFTWRI